MRIAIILMGILMSCSDKPIKPKQPIPNKTIDVLEDGKKISTFTYNQDNLPAKEIVYNGETKKIESQLVYIYKDKKLIDINVKGIDLDYLRYALDNIYQKEYLSTKGIKIEHPEIVGSEIGDLSNLLSIGDGYKDFKKDSIVNGNEKTIIYKSFNKKIRLHPSNITQFIPEDEVIKGYNLVVRDSLLIKESFLLENNQSLKREYFYENKRIKKITYISSDPNNKLRKEFIYKN